MYPNTSGEKGCFFFPFLTQVNYQDRKALSIFNHFFYSLPTISHKKPLDFFLCPENEELS